MKKVADPRNVTMGEATPSLSGIQFPSKLRKHGRGESKCTQGGAVKKMKTTAPTAAVVLTMVTAARPAVLATAAPTRKALDFMASLTA